MSSRPTPPRLGFRVPPPPPPRDQATAEDSAALRAGDLLDGRYQIEDQVGEGGVGVVYRALQLKLHRRVAVKLLQPETDDELRPRFEREAITLAALSHPNIVSLQDYGHTRGRPFLVMELLAGRTLRELVDEEGALPVPRALALTRQVLHALAYAHSLGVVHRDLKPANLLVQALPAYEHVKVLDFGFVKLLPGSYLDRGVQLSRVGFTFGTPAYMSPEHATGGEVDGRSDLYSMGILLFEMLTGAKPFDGELPELIRHHLSTPVPKLAERHHELTERADLQALIERALAKPRNERFASAGEFLQAIDDLTLSAASPGPSGTAGPGSALANAPAAGLDVELERLASAAQRFSRIAFATLKERGGPVLERAAEKTRVGAREAWTQLRSHALAVWAWVTPRILQLRGRLLPEGTATRNANFEATPAAAVAPPNEPTPPEIAPRQAATAQLPAVEEPRTDGERTEVDPSQAATVDVTDPQAQADIAASTRPSGGAGSP